MQSIVKETRTSVRHQTVSTDVSGEYVFMNFCLAAADLSIRQTLCDVGAVYDLRYQDSTDHGSAVRTPVTIS